MGDNKYLSIASDVLEKMQENMPIEKYIWLGWLI